MQNEQCQHIRFKGNTLGDDICADCGLSEMQITHRASVENEQMLRLAERLEQRIAHQREHGGDMMTYGTPDPLDVELLAFLRSRTGDQSNG